MTTRILAAASAHPTAAVQELLSILVNDPALTPDARIAVARRASVGGTSRLRRSGLGEPIGLVLRPNGSATQIRRVRGSSGAPIKASGVRVHSKAEAEKFAALDVLFKIAQDNTVSQVDRHQAASQAAQFFLPKNPRGKIGRRRKFPADEFGFAVDPELARELRDAKLKIVSLPLEKKKRTPHALAREVHALQARIEEIQQSLQCPCPSKYGFKDFERDIEQLVTLRQARLSGTIFSAEVDLEEAVRTARSDSFLKGPEIAATVRQRILQAKSDIAEKGGPPLNPVELTNFRFLSLLFPLPAPKNLEEMPAENREATLNNHPFIVPRYVVGNPNRPDGYLVLGTPSRRKLT